MMCPECGSDNSKVKDSREAAYGRLRRYLCLDCGYRWSTKEFNDGSSGLTANEYQRLAARTIDPKMSETGVLLHSLHGMVSEIGELHGLYQKNYQGHDFNPEHAKKELGDLLWFIAEYCTAWGWTLEDVMTTNIKKLKARYPEGFEAERSLHRAKDDI